MEEKIYQKAALRTDLSKEQYAEALNRVTDMSFLRLRHGVDGLVTESAELVDAIKRFAYYGKAIDLVNIVEELGDLDWYRNLLHDEIAEIMEISVEDLVVQIREKNIAKLYKRYPQSFDGFQAINRNSEEERIALEK